MSFLLSPFTNWLKSFLIDAIKALLTGIFSDLNSKVGDISSEVGQTPKGWNVNIFTMVQHLSQNVITPIAGIVLTYVACYELIAMITERNNLHDIDTWIFFKWIFKTAIAIFLITHTFDIVMAVFDVSQHVVQQSAGIINTQANLKFALDSLDSQLQKMNPGQLFGLLMQLSVVRFSIQIMGVLVFVIVYGRMLEIYMYCSIGPIPMATITNREWGDIGKNYLRTLLALGFQGFFIMVCVGIYATLIQTLSFSTSGGIMDAIWGALGYTLLLCFALFKTGSLSKSIFNSH